jgi:hypothetical protein
MGTYLAALVVYSGLVGQVPPGLPALEASLGQGARKIVRLAAVRALAATRAAVNPKSAREAPPRWSLFRVPLLETTRVPQVSLNGCIPLKQGHMFSLLG